MSNPLQIDRKTFLGSGLKALLAVLCTAAALLPAGCVVIPVGDLLRGPDLEEQVLVTGAGVFSKEKIAIVDVSGMITGAEDMSLFSSVPNSVSELKARLNLAASDREVRAVVLRISSPGGEVTACDIVHQEVKRLKEKARVPVVACIMDQGTSGGYYVACAADTIIAHPTSIVGSIGVIVPSFDLGPLLAKIGVNVQPIKSAEKKDINSIFRAGTEEERAILQKLVDDMYRRFLTVVDEGRPELDEAEVKALADGRVVSGVEAAEQKLVDRTGYLEDAVEEARERAGIESPTIVRYTRRAQGGSNVYTAQGVDAPIPSALELRLSVSPSAILAPGLYYLWLP